MSTRRDTRSHVFSHSESGLDHITNNDLESQVSPERRQNILLESPVPNGHHKAPVSAAPGDGRDMHSWPFHISAPKTTTVTPVRKLELPNGKQPRSCAWCTGDGWALEIIAAVCSLCCFVAIVAVLEVYDGQRSPSLPFGITLNAIISILSTTAKSSIMFGITAAIGQAKWDRFGCYRRLLDLEYIDQASRGPLGSIRILFTRTGQSIASVGAVITLLMLAVDPFVQQILLYRQEPSAVLSESAWTEQVLAPTVFSNNNDSAYSGAINSALWNEDISYERKAHCPTGNCTYPSFQSMGLCVTAREVPLDQISFGGAMNNCKLPFSNPKTGQVVFENATRILSKSFHYTCNVSFWGDNTTSLEMTLLKPKGIFGWPGNKRETLDNWEFALDFTGSMATELGGQHTVLGVRSPLLALGRMSWSSPSLLGNQSISIRFNKAEHVVIAFCASDYLTTVSQGVTSTSGADVSSPRGFSYSDNTTILGPDATCWTSGSEKATFPRSEIKQASHGRSITRASPLSFCTDNWGWADDIASRLTSNSYFGMRMAYDDEGAFIPSGWGFTDTSSINNHDVLQQIQSHSLQHISRSITASLNALFRKYSSDRINGSFIEYETVVRVQWAWLTLPVTVEVLGFMFLLWISLRNPKSPKPWKGSILATLFHGLRPSGDFAGTLDTITSMEQEATKTVVKLEIANGGQRFLRKQSDDTRQGGS